MQLISEISWRFQVGGGLQVYGNERVGFAGGIHIRLICHLCTLGIPPISICCAV